MSIIKFNKHQCLNKRISPWLTEMLKNRKYLSPRSLIKWNRVFSYGTNYIRASFISCNSPRQIFYQVNKCQNCLKCLETLAVWNEARVASLLLSKRVSHFRVRGGQCNLIKCKIFICHCAGSSLLQGPFSSCIKQGLLSSCGAWSSHCGFCCRAWAPGQAGFRSCGVQASLLCRMGDLLRPGIEPTSPVLQGRFLTTRPSGKPQNTLNEKLFFF